MSGKIVYSPTNQHDANTRSHKFTRRDWAWETLRRNREYRAAWQAARSEFEITAESDNRRVVIAHRTETALDRWGCLYTDEPYTDAHSAAVFWRSDKAGGMPHMTAHPPEAEIDAGHFCLAEMQIPSVLLLMPGNKQSLLFMDEGRGLQLSIVGESLRNPVRLSADAVPGQPDYARQIKLLACFNDLRLTGRLKPCYYLKEPQSDRLHRVVNALDLWLLGLSWEEIATALFGEDEVRENWREPNRGLRCRTYQLVQRGRRLMNGGYLRFLK